MCADAVPNLFSNKETPAGKETPDDLPCACDQCQLSSRKESPTKRVSTNIMKTIPSTDKLRNSRGLHSEGDRLKRTGVERSANKLSVEVGNQRKDDRTLSSEIRFQDSHGGRQRSQMPACMEEKEKVSEMQ